MTNETFICGLRVIAALAVYGFVFLWPCCWLGVWIENHEPEVLWYLACVACLAWQVLGFLAMVVVMGGPRPDRLKA